ncbi:hypothetical protein COCSADRAFT_238514 [Bipolaris sorokiniana ND90Pr]|uniref:Uncharacterized protein n=1 Tax=Cochliobolus sativus (strain ND90Pr / ATCC 201652) TaxID=665912 RepID=M2S191_COCSN|nr:uncharacterized protein COCSADRAFT_238514 [Bipolaris sorokiniana ND90Pr]EMD61023.1 hypothetical protein COCSADRAFT_238514 [Bipolaris sorokiniana ND90Pr]
MSGMITTFAIFISYCGILIPLRIGLKLDADIERMQTADSKSNVLTGSVYIAYGKGGTGRVL